MNLITLPLVNPRHHIGKLKGFAYLLFEAFMRVYFDAYMKLLYPLCLVRWDAKNFSQQYFFGKKWLKSLTKESRYWWVPWEPFLKLIGLTLWLRIFDETLRRLH